MAISAPLPGLVEAAERHGAIMMVDDAHSSGVLGRNGRGTIDHFGLHGRVDIQVGTLSKAIGVLGGYVCGSRDLIEFLYHRARPFLFSTSHPPAVAAACLAAFDVLEQEPERIERLWDNTRYFKQGLAAAGFNTGISETPITPVIVGEARAGPPAFARAVRERRAGHRHRLPHGAEGQSPRAHHRDRHAHHAQNWTGRSKCSARWGRNWGRSSVRSYASRPTVFTVPYGRRGAPFLQLGRLARTLRRSFPGPCSRASRA